ncbi:hypothetical protein ACOSQ3_022369 [Xanthoceras sorbifolium]
MRLLASSFCGAHLRLTRTIIQQKIRALVSAHRDRDKKKGIFVVLSYMYSRLIHNLYKEQLLLNSKILTQIAISNRNCLYMISSEIIK